MSAPTAFRSGLASFFMSWPKWISFTFVYGMTLGTLVAGVGSKLGAYCTPDTSIGYRCTHWGIVASIALMMVIGVAGFFTVSSVWTQRRSTITARWGATFVASLPLSLFVVAGTIAVLTLSNGLGDLRSFNPLLLTSLAVGVVCLLAAIPLVFIPVAVADGRSVGTGIRVFQVNRLATVALVGATLLVVFAAVLVFSAAMYLLPLFALVIPVLVLSWIEAYWQAIDPVDEAESEAERQLLRDWE